MKQIIKRCANSLGFHIARLSPNGSSPCPFEEMRRLFARNKKPVVFDVGAHYGQTAKRFRQAFPKSTIYSFEPFRDSYDHLRRNTEFDPSIRTFNFGLSDRRGCLKFNSNSSSATNSLLATHSEGAKTWGCGLLETRAIVNADFKTLDSVMLEEQVHQVNILKLDVQGAEHLVLRGAGSAIEQGRIDLIYSELLAQPTYCEQKRLDQALGIFYDCGFDLHNIFNLSLTETGQLRQMDAIFVGKQSGLLDGERE